MALIQKYGITVLPSMVIMPGGKVECKNGKTVITGDVRCLNDMPPEERAACVAKIKKRGEDALSEIYSRKLAEDPEKFWREHEHLFEKKTDEAAI